MRKAAGILMILYGVKTLGFFLGSLSKRDFLLSWPPYLPLVYLPLVVIISAVFIISGGFFCLKKKYWKLCLASSIYLLLYIMISDSYPIVPLPYPIVPLPFELTTTWSYWLYMNLTLLWGILPQIFVCLRKREWEEPDFLRDQPSILEI